MKKAPGAEDLVKSRSWYHSFEIVPGLMTPGVYDPLPAVASLALPEDMTGLTVLEIGPADGGITCELARRGAAVTAVDYVDKDHYGFAVMEAVTGCSARFIQANLYDLPALGLEPFDIVLCMGVLYHLPDLIRGLWALRALTKDRMLLETAVTHDGGEDPIARYLPEDTANGDITNFWLPNPACCRAMLKDCGYEIAREEISEERALFDLRADRSVWGGHKVKPAYDLWPG